MKILTVFTFTLACLMSYASSAESTGAYQNPLPIATNLKTLGQQALKQNIPIAILFSAKGLNSTEKLKDLALYPALRSGNLDGRVLFTEIEVNVNSKTVDFYGEPLANKEYKALYNLSSLPVVVFVDGEGDVITEQLLAGAYDYYYFYLKQSINNALKALKNPNLAPDL